MGETEPSGMVPAGPEDDVHGQVPTLSSGSHAAAEPARIRSANLANTLP